jgi:hypothetical protein
VGERSILQVALRAERGAVYELDQETEQIDQCRHEISFDNSGETLKKPFKSTQQSSSVKFSSEIHFN